MALTQTVAPTVEPITLAEAILHRQSVASDQEPFIEDDLIPAAREAAEDFLNLQLITATWQETFTEFPASGEIRFAKPPVQSVTSLKYLDSDGVEQTWAAENYDTQLTVVPSLLMPAYGVVWPTIRSGRYNSVTLTYVSGYGDAATAVPKRVRRFLYEYVGNAFEQRESFVLGERAWKVPDSLWEILRPFRNWRLD
jgi:uncharacterized phiE125 gp8 family phage protein